MEAENSPSLLYRYFFFNWLFRDVRCGSRFDQAAAWRHNQAQSRWLPTYLWRWSVLSLLLFSAGGLSSQVFAGPWIGVPFYVLFSISIPVSSVIVVAWLGLRFLPRPWER